jgi:hypothetical protein
MKEEYAQSQQKALRQAIKGLAIGIGAIAISVAWIVWAPTGSYSIVLKGAVIAGLALAARSIKRIAEIRKARREYEDSAHH